MNNIIDELLLLSSVRVEEVTPHPVNMGSVIKETIDRLGFLIDEYESVINYPAADAWPIALAYGPWIEEVWINYISNAIKYGGRPPHIWLGSQPHSDGAIEFWVKDNGPGLTPEEQTQLFVPFNRLNQIRAEGHGLGLSIVHRIVTKLGGRVAVKSTPGQGSIFSFFLPQG